MPSFERIVQLQVPRASGRIGIGSGTLVGDRLVLTAAHVVQNADGGGVAERLEVLLPALDEQVSGRVAWSGRAVGLDAALVELDMAPTGVPRRRPVRWGRLTGQQPVLAASAAGFPRSLREEGRQRVLEHASGRVNPGVGLGDRYDLLVDPPHPLAAAADPSPWSGFSGAGLFAGEQDLLIGVIALDLPNYQAGRLSSVPVWRLLEDTGFRSRLAEHDVATGWHSVELGGLFKPEHRRVGSPAALLRAETAVVRFRGRESVLGQLQRWCTADEGLSVALVTGPGGQGKTRLARQLCESMRAAGWVAGFSRTAASSDPLPALADSRVPVLVVVDYAETRSEQLHRLVTDAGDPDRPVRLLLLARSPAEWWSDLRAQWRSALGPPLELALPALEDTLTGRQQAYSEAVQDLTRALPRLSAQAGVNWATRADRVPSAPDLAVPAFGSVLTIQLLALTALLNGDDTAAASGDPEALEDVLLEHEQLYWQQLASRRAELPALQPVTLRRAVATATLCGAGSEDQAVATLARVGGLRDRTEDEYLGLARWLAELYPSAEGRYWGPLQPDRVGEHLIGQVTREQPSMVTEVLAGATEDQGHQALTILTRAADTQSHLAALLSKLIGAKLEQLGPIAVQVALQTAAPEPLLQAVRSAALQTDQSQQLQTLIGALPDRSLLLAQTSLTIQQHAVELARLEAQANRGVYLLNLAVEMHNLAFRLGKVGLRTKALVAVQEAVVLRRELIEIDRGTYLPGLATSTNNFAIALSETGLHAEALGAAQESVTFYRELVGLDRGAHLPGLAASMNSLAVALGETGMYTEAVEAARKAVNLRRELVELNCGVYLPNLAGALHTLSVELGYTSMDDEGLTTIKEAVSLRRKLVELNRDAHLPELAESLNNLAAWLGGAELHTEALAAAAEAVTYYQELTEDGREAHLPGLSASVHNLATELGEAGMHTDAVDAARKAVDLRRKLLLLNRGGHLEGLAVSLHSLALRLIAGGLHTEVMVVSREATKYYKELEQRNPQQGRWVANQLAELMVSLKTLLEELDRDCSA